MLINSAFDVPGQVKQSYKHFKDPTHFMMHHKHKQVITYDLSPVQVHINIPEELFFKCIDVLMNAHGYINISH